MKDTEIGQQPDIQSVAETTQQTPMPEEAPLKLNERCKIYLLTNKVNGKIYVGQTWLKLNIRMGRDGENYKNSPYLYNAIKKYGVENFEYTVLEITEDQKTADKLEAEYIIKYNSRDHNVGYNIKNGGSVGKHSEETKAKISKNSAKPWLGKHLTEETKRKLSETMTGRTLSDERKQEMSEIATDWHANNPHPMLGQHHTEEAKNKISNTSKERWQDPEYRANTVATMKENGKKLRMSPEKEQAIIAAYQSGATFKEICKDHKTNNSGIYRVLERNNIQLVQNRDSWRIKIPK